MLKYYCWYALDVFHIVFSLKVRICVYPSPLLSLIDFDNRTHARILCMPASVCAHTQTHTFTHACMHTHTHTCSIHMYKLKCTHAHTFSYLHVYTYMHIFIFACIHIHAHTHGRMRACTHTHTHTHLLSIIDCAQNALNGEQYYH